MKFLLVLLSQSRGKHSFDAKANNHSSVLWPDNHIVDVTTMWLTYHYLTVTTLLLSPLYASFVF